MIGFFFRGNERKTLVQDLQGQVISKKEICLSQRVRVLGIRDKDRRQRRKEKEKGTRKWVKRELFQRDKRLPLDKENTDMALR